MRVIECGQPAATRVTVSEVKFPGVEDPVEIFVGSIPPGVD